MPIEKALLPDWKKVEAQLTTHDVEIVQQYAQMVHSPNCYVEIGTMFGGGALRAAGAVNPGVDVYSIDPNWDRLMPFHDELTRAGIVFMYQI